MNSAEFAIAENQEEVLKGRIDRIVFRSDESGFTVMRVTGEASLKEHTVAGIIQPLREGENIECTGVWFLDKKWGKQFKPHSVRILQPSSKEGIVKYLSSGLIKGIGPKLAKKLVHYFGDETFKVIENNPNRLLEIDDIGPKRVHAIAEAFKTQKVVADIMSFLMQHGLGTNRAYKIYKLYGDESISLIKQNPYRLSRDVWGIGFKQTDKIALSIGIKRNSEFRARAGLHSQLEDFTKSGSCAVEKSILIKKTAAMLNVEPMIVGAALRGEIDDGELIEQKIGSKEVVYPVALYCAEVNTVECLVDLMGKHALFLNSESAHVSLEKIEKSLDIELNEDQRAGVIRAMTGKVSILTGLPGTGKTTTLNTVLKVLTDHKVNVVLAAPAGRAAKRMTEATGIEAHTIHRLLGAAPGGRFKHDEDNPIEADYVVVDETSMLDIQLMSALLCTIPTHASLLLVGDTDQLPSIMPGNVLGDLINSGMIPVTRLTQIYRQAASSLIIQNAHAINKGQKFETFSFSCSEGEKDFFFVAAEEQEQIQERILDAIKWLTEKQGFDLMKDIQVLTPVHKTETGTQELNTQIQKIFNAHIGPEVNSFGYKFGLNDKVMQRRNDYEKGVYNGDAGYIIKIDEEEKEVTVGYDEKVVVYDYADLDDLMPAYAVSVHKAQGSEFPAVIMPITTSHHVMLERCLLYTAVTRAKRMLVLVGQPSAMDIAIKNIRARKRISKLAERIKEALQESPTENA